MLASVGKMSMSEVQALFVVLFSVTFTWIAFSSASALTGLLMPSERFREVILTSGSRTVLLMPVHNENPLNLTAALQAMAEALNAMNAAAFFEIAIISDTTDADAWIAETIAINRLRNELDGVIPVWYRRRLKNTGRKPGNVEEFVRRWGGRYDYFIMLDADSLMSAQVLTTLVKRMEADPTLGLLQTLPLPICRWSLFARLQQFSARVYGGPVARGVAAWSGDDGNYWGHNAIVRISAYAQACALPELHGPKPFGGYILSHDFVEAALMRRSGWKVRMATDLQESWEESPPSLTDVAVRDRRWAQGNLQHVKVIGSCGLSSASRLHFLMGIMSYISSPLWLTLIVTGFLLLLQTSFIGPENPIYRFQLFPHCPQFDAVRMIHLYFFSMIVLFLPQMAGIFHTIVSPNLRRSTGGMFLLLISSLVEIVFSALYAPIRMLFQTRHIIEILSGKDSGWAAQKRSSVAIRWIDAWYDHRRQVIGGILAGCLAYMLSPAYLYWLSPVLLSLILSIPLSRMSGSVSIGRALGALGILRTPEEFNMPGVVRRRDEIARVMEPAPSDGLRYLAVSSKARLMHINSNLPLQHHDFPDADYLAAEKKIVEAKTLTEALGKLTRAERLQVAGDRRLLEFIGELPDV
jgi:membrane glycosyltransferase